MQLLKQLFSCKSTLGKRKKISAAQNENVTKDNKALFKIIFLPQITKIMKLNLGQRPPSNTNEMEMITAQM